MKSKSHNKSLENRRENTGAFPASQLQHLNHIKEVQMSQFLFIVEIPSSKGISPSPGYPHEWIQFANDANTILSPVKTYTRYQQNVWSLSL